MQTRTMTMPSLMRAAANSAEVCMNDPRCIVKFDGRGVEPQNDGKYVVNLPGAFLIKACGQGSDKSFMTQGEPPWQAALHELGRGNVFRALELAFGRDEKVAPKEAISQLETQYHKIVHRSKNVNKLIAWVKESAKTLEKLSEWKCAEDLIEIKDTPRSIARGYVTSRPFATTCGKILELIDDEKGLRTKEDWGTVDFFEVRDTLLRIRSTADQLVDVSNHELSKREIDNTKSSLEDVLQIITKMRNWDLASENAANDRLEYISQLKQYERYLRQSLQGWFPLWTSLQVKEKKEEAEQTEQRAKHAQAEASGEAASVIGDAYKRQADLDKVSRYCWTALALLSAVAIIFVNMWILNSVETIGTDDWRPERVDSIITRLLCTSILGGIAYWAGRIATIKLDHETDHLHKAVIARTLGGMKEGVETTESRERLGLMTHARLSGQTRQPQSDQSGPVAGDPGPHIREGVEKAIESNKNPWLHNQGASQLARPPQHSGPRD